MGSHRPDQRQFYRVSVAFRVEGADRTSQQARLHALRDISPSGLRITSEEAIAPGQRVEVRFPDIDPVFLARATTVWCERRDDEFEIGLQLDADSPDYEAVCTRIQEIEKYRKTVEDLRGQELAPEDAARQWFSKFGSSV